MQNSGDLTSKPKKNFIEVFSQSIIFHVFTISPKNQLIPTKILGFLEEPKKKIPWNQAPHPVTCETAMNFTQY